MSLKVLAAGAIVSIRLLPNTIFLDRYRKFRATYGFDDNELPIPQKIKQRFREVMDDLKLPERVRNRIKIFSVHDIDIFHAGCVQGGFGALIGIPPNYDYESVENLSMDQVTIQNTKIPWTEETSKDFLKSLVLSENAQKFAIAREILTVQQSEFWVKQFNTFVDCLITFLLYDLLNSLLKFSKKPMMVAVPAQTAIGLVGVVIWLITEELIDISADRDVTQKLTELGPEYIRGGKEFYEKLCERDSVMKQFFDESMLKLINTTWIKKTMLSPLEQKELFNLKLQEIEEIGAI